MRIIKKENQFGLINYIKEEDRYISNNYDYIYDLYWSIHSNNRTIENDTKSDIFIITKETNDLYNTFEKLYYDIEEINLYEEDDKDKYRLYNYSNYQELFDEENKTITWYSDETAKEVANYLKIKKEEDCFILSFNIQEHIKGYDKDFSTPNYIPIRFRNSGSRYDPFNTIFMEMYERLQKIENKDENCHQITLEEYLNNLDKEKVLNKTKNN